MPWYRAWASHFAAVADWLPPESGRGIPTQTKADDMRVSNVNRQLSRQLCRIGATASEMQVSA